MSLQEHAVQRGLVGLHELPSNSTKEFDLGGGVKFTHELAYKKGVDCINCHSDVIRGKGEVPRERCMVCHNREGDLARISDFKFMHQKHVSEHKIDCLDCHLKIDHSLDKSRLTHFAENCQSCHPNHHQEQIMMFQGVGSEMMPGSAGGMTATRLVCQACHKVKEVSPTGAVLWAASVKVCSACHEAAEIQELKNYHDSLRLALPKIGEEIARVGKALESASLGRIARRLFRMNWIKFNMTWISCA